MVFVLDNNFIIEVLSITVLCCILLTHFSRKLRLCVNQRGKKNTEHCSLTKLNATHKNSDTFEKDKKSAENLI